MQVSQKVFDWNGNRVQLGVVRDGVQYDGAIEHGDVVQVALTFDCFYLGLAGGGFGIRWGLSELSYVAPAAKGSALTKCKAVFDTPAWAM